MTNPSQNLNKYVFEEIRRKIISGEYTPGMKLPNEFELAEAYSVCRYTVREAIKELAAVGLITVKRGKGTYVNEMMPEQCFKPMLEKMVLLQRDMNEIFDARLAIEQKTVALAAQKAQEDDIAALKQLIYDMQASIDQGNIDQYNDQDFLFHKQLAKASKNRILDTILDTLQDMVRYSIVQAATLKQSKYQKSHDGHKAIVNAIAAHDGEGASQKMLEHLDYCKNMPESKKTDMA